MGNLLPAPTAICLGALLWQHICMSVRPRDSRFDVPISANRNNPTLLHQHIPNYPTGTHVPATTALDQYDLP